MARHGFIQALPALVGVWVALFATTSLNPVQAETEYDLLALRSEPPPAPRPSRRPATAAAAAVLRGRIATAASPPRRCRAGDWGPASCAAYGGCSRQPYGTFSVYGVVPSNVNKDDPDQMDGYCPTDPPYSADAITPSDTAALNCIFQDYAAMGERVEVCKAAAVLVAKRFAQHTAAR